MLNIKVVQRYYLPLLVLIYLCFQLPLLTTITNVWVDEPWYANTAYNYSIGNGLVNTIPGRQGGDDLFIYTFLLGSFYKVFGTSLFISILFSVMVGLATLIGLIFIIKKLALSTKKIFLISLMFIFSNVTYIVFRTVRPEAMVLFFLVWSFYFLLRGENDSNWINYFISGFLISLSLLCHPNGALMVLFFLAYVVYKTVREKKYFVLAGFLGGGILAFLILSYQVMIVKEMNFLDFLRELTTQEKRFNRSALGSDSTIINFFTQGFGYLSNWIEDYILGFKRLFILFFEIGILIAGLIYYKKNKFIFILSLMGITYFILSVSVFHPFILRAFGNVIFFSLVVFGLILKEIELTQLKRSFKIIVITLGIIYLMNNLAGNLFIIKRDYNKTAYSEIEYELDKAIPDDKIVLTLFNFWFAFKNNEMFADYTNWMTKNYSGLDDLILKDEADYIVISDYMKDIGGTTTGRKEEPDFLSLNVSYYNKVIDYARSEGKFIKQLKTNNYGTIQIFKMK